MNEPFHIERLTGPDASLLLAPLFREYGSWVATRLEAELGLVFAEPELERAHTEFDADLPKLLGPGGRLLLAWAGEEAVGVGALKPVDRDTAEIKRMYVRPQSRGLGVGRAILSRLVDDGRLEGYRTLRLESLFFMVEAHALYRSLGFVDTKLYDGAETAAIGFENVAYFMELALALHAQARE